MSNSNPCVGHTIIFKDIKDFQRAAVLKHFLFRSPFIPKYVSKLVNLSKRFNIIASGRIGLAMGPHAACGPPV
jgi:hypothetical protein